MPGGRPASARWKDEVGAIWPEAAALIAGIDDPGRMVHATYVHATVRRPFAERLALIGDAAHATSPQLGQGANMGLLDAAALADAIDRHRRSRGGARRLRVGALAACPLLPGGELVADADVPVREPACLRFLRDAGFPLARQIPYVRRDIAVGFAGLKASLFGRIEVQEDA